MSSSPNPSQFLAARTCREFNAAVQTSNESLSPFSWSNASQQECSNFLRTISVIIDKVDDIFSLQQEKEHQTIAHQIDAVNGLKFFFSGVSFSFQQRVLLAPFAAKNNCEHNKLPKKFSVEENDEKRTPVAIKHFREENNILAQRIADIMIFTLLGSSAERMNDECSNDLFRDDEDREISFPPPDQLLKKKCETIHRYVADLRCRRDKFLSDSTSLESNNKAAEIAQLARLDSWIRAFDTPAIAAVLLGVLEKQVSATESKDTKNADFSLSSGSSESIVGNITEMIGVVAHHHAGAKHASDDDEFYEENDLESETEIDESHDDSSFFCSPDARDTLLRLLVACRLSDSATITNLCSAIASIAASQKGARIFRCSETAEAFTTLLQALQADKEGEKTANHRNRETFEVNMIICTVVSTIADIARSDRKTKIFASHPPLASVFCRMLQHCGYYGPVREIAQAMTIFSAPKCRASMFALPECVRSICSTLQRTEVLTEESFGIICGVLLKTMENREGACRTISTQEDCFESLLLTLDKLNDFSAAQFFDPEANHRNYHFFWGEDKNKNKNNGEEVERELKLRIVPIHLLGSLLCNVVAFNVIEKNDGKTEHVVTEIVQEQFTHIMSTLYKSFGTLRLAKEKKTFENFHSMDAFALDAEGNNSVIYAAAVDFEILRCLYVNIMKSSENHKATRNKNSENEILTMPFGGMYRGSLRMGKADNDENEDSEPHRNEILRDWIAVSSLIVCGLDVVIKINDDVCGDHFVRRALKGNGEFIKSMQCVQQQFESIAGTQVIADLIKKDFTWGAVIQERRNVLTRILSQFL